MPDLGFPHKDFRILEFWHWGKKVVVKGKNVFPEICLFFTKINITIEEQ